MRLAVFGRSFFVFLFLTSLPEYVRADENFLQNVIKEKNTRQEYARLFGLINKGDQEKIKDTIAEGKYSATLILRWVAHNPKQIELARALVNNMGADVSDRVVQANAGRTQNMPLIRVILEKSKDPTNFLEMSASEGDLSHMKALFEMCDELGIKIDSALPNRLIRHSVEQGLKDVARFLIGKGAKPSEVLKRSTSVVSNVAMLVFALEFPQTREAIIQAAKYAAAKKDMESMQVFLKYLPESDVLGLPDMAKEEATLVFTQKWERECDYYNCKGLEQKELLDKHLEKGLISQDYALFLTASWSQFFGKYADRRDDFVHHLATQKGAIASQAAVHGYIRGSANHLNPPMKFSEGLKILLVHGLADPRWVLTAPEYNAQNLDPELFVEMIKHGHITPNRLLEHAVSHKNTPLARAALGYGATFAHLDSSLSSTAYDFLMDSALPIACDSTTAFADVSLFVGVEKGLALLNTKCGQGQNSRFDDVANEMLARANLFKIHEEGYWKKFKEETYTFWSDYYMKLFHTRMNELPPVTTPNGDVVTDLLARIKCLPGTDCTVHEKMLRKIISGSPMMRGVIEVAVRALEEEKSFVQVYEDVSAKYLGQYWSLTRRIHLNMGSDVSSETFARTLIHELTHLAMDMLFKNNKEAFEKGSTSFDSPYVMVFKAIARLFGDARDAKSETETHALMLENIGMERTLSEPEQKAVKSLYFVLLYYKKDEFKKEFVAQYISHLDLIETMGERLGAQNPFAQMQDYFSRIVGDKIQDKLAVHSEKSEL